MNRYIECDDRSQVTSGGQIPPDCNESSRTALDVKKAGSLEFTGLAGLLWTALDMLLVKRSTKQLPGNRMNA